ncbi:hypothetical protein ABY44_17555 [Burkholderia sp. ZZQ-2]|uniref:hypothetical protein n=1 Tax=Burkholderia sp. ZZQ-2 TaxID=1661766 RepID=UPI003D6E21BC
MNGYLLPSVNADVGTGLPQIAGTRFVRVFDELRHNFRTADELTLFLLLGMTSREQPSDTDIVTPDVGAQVVEEVDRRLLQLVDDVANGKVRPTVDGIREHFNCAQKTASHLRRRYQALCDATQSTTLQS